MKYLIRASALAAFALAGAQTATAQHVRPLPAGSQLQDGATIRGVVITSYRGNIESIIVGHNGHDYEVFCRDRRVNNGEPLVRITRFASGQGKMEVAPGKYFNDIVRATIKILSSGKFDNTGAHYDGPMLKSLRERIAPPAPQWLPADISASRLD